MDPSNARKLPLIIGIIVGVLLLIGALVLYLRQPTTDDYKMARDTRIKELSTARDAVRPAVNKYLAAFKAAYNQSGSADSAVKAAKPEYDAFKKAEQKATDALDALTSNRIANVGETATAVDQLKKDYTAELAYYDGMVDSYADYTVLFSDKEERCSGIFIGQTDGLADRRDKLNAAAKQCFTALTELKQSENASFVDYAKKVERRVKQMQDYAAVTAGGEAKVKEFEAKVADYQKQLDAATARNAGEAEYKALTEQIKKTNAEIAENKAQFDYSASRYLALVREMPTLYADVFDKAVPARIKYYDQLIDGRVDVLGLLLDGKIDAASA